MRGVKERSGMRLECVVRDLWAACEPRAQEAALCEARGQLQLQALVHG